MSDDSTKPAVDAPEKFNKATRLAVAGLVAPYIRESADRNSRRRVARVDAAGNVVGYTTVAEIQRALLKKNEIEFSVDGPDAKQRDLCTECSRPFKQSPRGKKYTKCPKHRYLSDQRCVGFGDMLGQCQARAPRRALSPSVARTRDGAPWMCKPCATRKRHVDNPWVDGSALEKANAKATKEWRRKIGRKGQRCQINRSATGRGNNFIDLTGHVYGRLTVLALVGDGGLGDVVVWQCRCQCGSVVEKRSGKLRHGRANRCGKSCSLGEIDWSDPSMKRPTQWRQVRAKRPLGSDRLCECGAELAPGANAPSRLAKRGGVRARCRKCADTDPGRGDKIWSARRPAQESQDVEMRAKVIAALDASGGNQTRAAKILGVTHHAVSYYVKRFNLPRPGRGWKGSR